MNATRTRVALGLLAALAVSGALIGCGASASSDDDGVASANGKGGTASSSAAPKQSADPVKFTQCMREHGIDVPDMEDGKFAVQFPKGMDKTKVDAAMQDCKQYMPNGGEAMKPDAQMLEQQRQMAKCMRENGVPNFPDPGDDGGIRLEQGSGIDPESDTFKAAQQACQKYQPSPQIKEQN